jgi:ribonuclease P protein component
MFALTEDTIAESGRPAQKASLSGSRLRKHADYQRVYRSGRKQFSSFTSYFVRMRDAEESAFAGTGPRVGLTVGKVMGNAVARNRIKRRMREAIRLHLSALTADVDLVLHPKKSVAAVEFESLEREILKLFRSVQSAAARVL